MWPGEQPPGGQQYPQGAPTPPQQPPGGYGQPNPYAQPGPPPPPPPQTPGYGYPQQGHQPGPQPPPYAAPTQPYGTPAPSPYAQPGYQQQPGGYPTPQQWGPPVPGGPDGPPPKNRNTTTIAIAVTAAVAVIAAVIVGAVYFTGDGKKKDAQDDKSPTPTATVSPSPTATPSPTDTGSAPADSGGSTDNPRGAPVDVKPVIPGWKVVERDQRNVLFDVPPDWSVDSQGMTIGFEDKSGNPAVAMSAPAYYKHDFCTSGSSTFDRAAVGTKGANGATSVRNAAEVQATAWAYWAYQDNGKGTFSKALDSKAFHNSHGISGWQARATATNVPTPNKCSSSAGEAFTVAWLDPTQSDPTKKLVVWVLYADRGVKDQLAQSTIDKIMSSIRLIKK